MGERRAEREEGGLERREGIGEWGELSEREERIGERGVGREKKDTG